MYRVQKREPTKRSGWLGHTVLLFVFVGLFAGERTVYAEKEGDKKPSFTERPFARVEGDKVVIRFAVNTPTDVAVLVRNEEGRPVRHLAAGLLGANAPEPLQKNTLTQSLDWDLRDDDGLPVPSGRYKVEVGVGLTVSMDNLFSWNPYAIGVVHGMGVGLGGELYVMAAEGRDCLDGVFRVFGPDGKYRRTILPRPAGIALERVLPLGELVLKSGEHFPTVLLPNYRGRILQVPIVTSEGDLILVNSSPTAHVEGKRFRSKNFNEQLPRRLLRIAAEGGAPQTGVLGPVLGPGFANAVVYLAQGPDGLIYFGGARHAVFRVAWGEKESPQVFVGKTDEPGRGPDRLKNPCGIAFDADGNLYVADRGNHRVAVFDRAGRFLSEVPVEWPQQVQVHPRTGALYVTRGAQQFELLKFESFRTSKPCASYAIRSDMPLIALETRGRRTIVYLANVWFSPSHKASRDRVIVRLEDHGREFREVGTVGELGRPRQPMVLGVDREREVVYGAWASEGYWRMDGRTGRLEDFDIPLHPKANGISEISVGADGTVLVHVTSEMGRLDHHLKPIPFSVTGSFIVPVKEDCLRSYYAKDCCVAPNGDIYWIHERGGYSQPFRVSTLHADGATKKDSILILETASAAGIRVDRRGNIYVLDHLKPMGKPLPDEVAEVLQPDPRDTHVEHYGSVLKFRPEGGSVRRIAKGAALAPGEQRFMAGMGQVEFAAQGLLWSWYGVSMLRSWHVSSGCKCWTPRFDLDDFGRVFVPDQLRSRIVVLDCNGNVVCFFGRYGNPDDKGPGVLLADPRTVMVSREAVYVGDMTNQRVVRGRLGYCLSATCTVKVEGRTLTDLGREYGEKGQIEERRLTLRYRNAEARLEEVRGEVARWSPSLARRLDWKKLLVPIASQSALGLSNLDDARAIVALTAPRAVPEWNAQEARAVLGTYLESENEWLRLCVVWGLWGGTLYETGRELLLRALKDTSEKVRVAAACCLLERDDPTGLAVAFKAACSSDPVTFKLAETAILKKALVYDPTHPKAWLIDPRTALVPRYPIGKAQVEALVPLLDRGSWYLDRATLILLGTSGQPEAAEAILKRLERFRDRNLNRAIAALGTLRCYEAVPEIIRYLARGRAANYGTLSYDGDEAEKAAATALARIADPASVASVITLLDSDKPNTGSEALRCLSLMFDPFLPADLRLIPREGRLEDVRVDELPSVAEIRSAWERFWQENSSRYSRGAEGFGLMRKESVD